MDSNTFAAYKSETNGNIAPVKFDNEEVQSLLAGSADNTTLQQNALSLLNYNSGIPSRIDKEAFISIIRAIPLTNRIIEWRNVPAIVLVTPNNKILINAANKGTSSFQVTALYSVRNGSWDLSQGFTTNDPEVYRTWFAYLGTQNLRYTDDDLIRGLRTAGQNNREALNAIITAEPPMAEGSSLAPKIYNNIAYVINTQNPRTSFSVSSNTGRLTQANISPANADIILGRPTPTAAATATGRRGRPAGGGAPRQQAPAAPVAAGDINVREVMSDTGLETAFLRLPRIILRKLNRTNASRVDPNGDRGAARRNNQLGGRGRVGRIIQVGGSKIYFISLPGARIVASINVQPGNSNYLLVGNDGGNVAMPLNSPSDLVQALQQRGLAEHHNYLVREFLNNYPEHTNEVKNILKQHLNK